MASQKSQRVERPVPVPPSIESLWTYRGHRGNRIDARAHSATRHGRRHSQSRLQRCGHSANKRIRRCLTGAGAAPQADPLIGDAGPMIDCIGDWKRHLALDIHEQERLRIQQLTRTGRSLAMANLPSHLKKFSHVSFENADRAQNTPRKDGDNSCVTGISLRISL